MNRAKDLARSALGAFGLQYAYFEFWWKHLHRAELETDWSARHKAFFIHVPKTAGTSIYRSLGMDEMKYTHFPARVLTDVFGPKIDDCYLFSFVRNPWDRAVSLFDYVKHGTDWSRQQGWARRHLADLDFDGFCHRLERSSPFRNAVMSENFFFPQCYFTHDRRHRQIVNEVFRFETLPEDFARLADRFGARGTLLHERRTNARRDWRERYTDETRRIIGRLYADDVRLFGYVFDEGDAEADEVGRGGDGAVAAAGPPAPGGAR